MAETPRPFSKNSLNLILKVFLLLFDMNFPFSFSPTHHCCSPSLSLLPHILTERLNRAQKHM